jgi:hypothetical protein
MNNNVSQNNNISSLVNSASEKEDCFDVEKFYIYLTEQADFQLYRTIHDEHLTSFPVTQNFCAGCKDSRYEDCHDCPNPTKKNTQITYQCSSDLDSGLTRRYLTKTYNQFTGKKILRDTDYETILIGLYYSTPDNKRYHSYQRIIPGASKYSTIIDLADRFNTTVTITPGNIEVTPLVSRQIK